MSSLDKYLVAIMTGAFLLLFVFWSIGYFANALYGYHFELNSAWQGFGALGGAGGMSILKYITDSCKNSAPGQMPWQIQKGDDKDGR